MDSDMDVGRDTDVTNIGMNIDIGRDTDVMNVGRDMARTMMSTRTRHGHTCRQGHDNDMNISNDTDVDIKTA